MILIHVLREACFTAKSADLPRAAGKQAASEKRLHVPSQLQSHQLYRLHTSLTWASKLHASNSRLISAPRGFQDILFFMAMFVKTCVGILTVWRLTLMLTDVLTVYAYVGMCHSV